MQTKQIFPDSFSILWKYSITMYSITLNTQYSILWSLFLEYGMFGGVQINIMSKQFT